jgi:hypothetical protein
VCRQVYLSMGGTVRYTSMLQSKYFVLADLLQTWTRNSALVGAQSKIYIQCYLGLGEIFVLGTKFTRGRLCIVT